MSGPLAAPRSGDLAAEPAVACAQIVVGALLSGGVTDAVLAPGSRSAPFAYVLHAAERAGMLRLHVRIDERTAAFLALGLAKASARPVPVITTSGTAAANLHPAVLEAAASGVPLIAVTADRPAALRNSGANQTTDQLALFGTQVRGFAALEDCWKSPAGWATELARLLALATGVRTRHPGPVHVDVGLTEPLVPSGAATPVRPASSTVQATRPAEPVELAPGPRTVVVAGDAPPEAGRSAAALAAAARIPLLAEPSSNARRGPAALAGYRVLLGSRLADEIERVVVVGRPTLSRPVLGLLSRSDVELVVMAAGADWPDPGLRRPAVVDAVDVARDPTDWLERWRSADRRVSAALATLVRGERAVTGPGLARAVLGALPAGEPLVLGSSNPVRDADLVPIRDDLGDVFANRGLAGIDGTLSTAVGVALASGRPAHALIGDLTFLHDLTGLVIGPDEPRPDLRVVVANDDGGSIFVSLEHGRAEYADAYERLFGTPHHADLSALAAAAGVRPRRVSGLDELTTALADPPRGIEVVEVAVDRAGRRALDRAITGLAATL